MKPHRLIRVSSLVLICGVALLLRASPLASAAHYTLPVSRDIFKISQYPESVIPRPVACTHLRGTRNAEAYDILATGSPVPIYAVADGVLEWFGPDVENNLSQGYGNRVILRHDGGRRSLYAHLDSFSFTPEQVGKYRDYDAARKGDDLETKVTTEPPSISAGTQIGTMGSTGISSGRHLHFSFHSTSSSYGGLGDPLPLDGAFPEFALTPEEISQKKASYADSAAFTPDGCPEGSAQTAGSSTSASSVDVKTGTLGFRVLYERVNALYSFSIGIGGILAFLLIVYAGARYSLSLGNASKAKEALDQAKAALGGLVLLLAVYPILFIVNPCIVDPLRTGIRRDADGNPVRVPICSVSQRFGGSSVGRVSVTSGSGTAAPSSVSIPTPNVKFEDQKVVFVHRGVVGAQRASRGDTVTLQVATGFPVDTPVTFDVYELDASVIGSEHIRTLIGKVDADGFARANWVIDEEGSGDAKKAGDVVGDFEFTARASFGERKRKSSFLVSLVLRVAVSSAATPPAEGQ